MVKNPTLTQRIFFIAMSIFLIWQSYQTIFGVSMVEHPSWKLQLFFALIFNLYITGIFAFAGFALPTENLMPSQYYKISNAQRLKYWFQQLNGELFRKFLLATVWKNKDQQKKYFDGTINGIKHFETQTKKSEFGHLIPLFLITALCFYLAFLKMWWCIFFTMIVNTIFNFYPVLLQRHHRSRLARMEKILIQKQKR